MMLDSNPKTEKTKTKQDINRSDKWFATLENCVYS